MRKQVQIALLIGSSFLMSGCALFQSNSTRLQAGLRIPEQAEPHAFAQQQLEAGRAALATQNYASAIAAFRNAGLEPEFAAASHNGLAVAYAGIGRNDLAERYFRLAIAEEPATKRYADNLVRLQRANFAIEQSRLARGRLAPPMEAIRQAQIMRGNAMRASLEAAPTSPRIERTSLSGVRVGSFSTRTAVPLAETSGPRRELLPRIVVRDSPVLPDAAKPDPARPEGLATPIAAAPLIPAVAASHQMTVVVPQTDPVRTASTLETTGRRIPQEQFAEIFAPYAGGEARAPIMAGISSPGLRSSALPQPTFGSSFAQGESLALAGK